MKRINVVLTDVGDKYVLEEINKHGYSIGSFLQKLRKEDNLTQKDIAMLCNVTTQAVSKWERGDSIPDIEILEKLSILYLLSIRLNTVSILLFYILLLSFTNGYLFEQNAKRRIFDTRIY